MSESESDNSASVLRLPIASIGSGAPMVTVRVPQALVNVVADLYPHVDFPMGATLAAEDAMKGRQALGVFQAAIAENQRLKVAYAELALQYREELRQKPATGA